MALGALVLIGGSGSKPVKKGLRKSTAEGTKTVVEGDHVVRRSTR